MRMSILTPTYNRSKKLKRLYESLEKSTCKDFEWIIMNDGSSDDTELVVNEIKRLANFNVIYLYQTNSGKHVAMNRLYEQAAGEYCVVIDDDDELMPDAVEKALKIWDGMSQEEKEKCWCVCGLCIDSETRKIVGKPFEKNVNQLKGKAKKKSLIRVRGERCGFQRTSVMKEYKFPEVKGCSYIPEGYMWELINKRYNQMYVNEIFRVYYQNDGESLISFKTNVQTYKRRFVIFKYLLGKDCMFKARMFSKRNLINVYNLRTTAAGGQIASKEMYSGLKFSNAILVWFMALPCFLLRKKRKE